MALKPIPRVVCVFCEICQRPLLCVVCEGTLQVWFMEVTSAYRGNHNCGGYVYPYRGYYCRGCTEPEGNLCRVPDLLQNSQKCRVLWCNCHRTHRSIGYCGATVTELTEVVCGVTTDGNYPRYRSVGTLQNLSIYICTWSVLLHCCMLLVRVSGSKMISAAQ